MKDEASRFGATLRALRQEHGMSLAELAARSGVSRAMLSKVERGEKSPTLSVASRIAQGLSLSLSGLLGSSLSHEVVRVTRRADRPAFVDPETGFAREVLEPPSEGSPLEVVRHVLPGGGGSGELRPYRPGTRKCVLMEAGVLRLRVGAAEVELHPGDCASFDADAPHEFRNAAREPCSYHLVISRAF